MKDIRILEKYFLNSPQNNAIIKKIIDEMGFEKISYMIKDQEDMYFYIFMRNLNHNESINLLNGFLKYNKNKNNTGCAGILDELEELLAEIDPPSEEGGSD